MYLVSLTVPEGGCHGSRQLEQKPKDHIFNHKQKAESTNWTWGEAIILIKPEPRDVLPPAKNVPPPPNSATSWVPSFQIPDPMGTFLIQSTKPIKGR